MPNFICPCMPAWRGRGSRLAFAAMFAYISGAPFVLQNVYGTSPQQFAAIFALNSLGLVACSQVNGWLAGRVPARRVLVAGLGASCFSGCGIVAVVATSVPHLWALVFGLFVLVSSMSFGVPNATVLAMSRHPERAGSASALLGVTQFAIGAAVAPLVGLGGDRNAMPMAVAIWVLTVGAAAKGILQRVTTCAANLSLPLPSAATGGLDFSSRINPTTQPLSRKACTPTRSPPETVGHRSIAYLILQVIEVLPVR